MHIKLIFFLSIVSFFSWVTLSNELFTEFKVGAVTFKIPVQYVYKSSPSKGRGADTVGPVFSLKFSKTYLRDNVPGYDETHNGDTRYPSQFSVTAFRLSDVSQNSSKVVSDMLALKGAFVDAKIEAFKDSRYYKISRNVMSQNQWFYTTKNPRDAPISPEDIVAECHMILASKKISQCYIGIVVEPLFLKIELSNSNMDKVEIIKSHIVQLFNRWENQSRYPR